VFFPFTSAHILSFSDASFFRLLVQGTERIVADCPLAPQRVLATLLWSARVRKSVFKEVALTGTR